MFYPPHFIDNVIRLARQAMGRSVDEYAEQFRVDLLTSNLKGRINATHTIAINYNGLVCGRYKGGGSNESRAVWPLYKDLFDQFCGQYIVARSKEEILFSSLSPRRFALAGALLIDSLTDLLPAPVCDFLSRLRVQIGHQSPLVPSALLSEFQGFFTPDLGPAQYDTPAVMAMGALSNLVRYCVSYNAKQHHGQVAGAILSRVAQARFPAPDDQFQRALYSMTEARRLIAVVHGPFNDRPARPADPIFLALARAAKVDHSKTMYSVLADALIDQDNRSYEHAILMLQHGMRCPGNWVVEWLLGDDHD